MSTQVFTTTRQAPLNDSVDPVTGTTFPINPYLIYTNVASTYTLANPDDNTTNLASWGGRVRSARVQCLGSNLRYLFQKVANNGPTASTGLQLAAGAVLDIDMELLDYFNFQPEGAASVVTVQLFF